MKTPPHSIRSRQTESLRPQPVKKRIAISNPLRAIRKICDGFLDLCFSSSEPRIRAIADRWGEVRWRVYDPNCSRVLWFESHEQLLVWLEKRHHTQTDADRSIANLDSWR